MTRIPTLAEERRLVCELRDVEREIHAALDELLAYGRTTERRQRLARAEVQRDTVLAQLAVLPEVAP